MKKTDLINLINEYNLNVTEKSIRNQINWNDINLFSSHVKRFRKTVGKNLQNINDNREIFLREFQNYFDWNMILINSKINYSLSFIREFQDKFNWVYMSIYQSFTIDALREFKDKIKWDDFLEYQKLSEDCIREFKDKLNWTYISAYQKLSESFIREFQDKVQWNAISKNQKLSEPFIREFKDKVNWEYISAFQTLSESFIKEFKNKVDWRLITIYQNLSEDFISEFEYHVDWRNISIYQNLSQEFLKEFELYIDIELYNEVHQVKTREVKITEMTEYAQIYNLKFDGEYLYAFRNHNHWGTGTWNKSLTYNSGVYYRDWHCDMRRYEKNSFGLGIWPKGNTPVKIAVDDWGLWLKNTDGKCRVWGFTIL